MLGAAVVVVCAAALWLYTQWKRERKRRGLMLLGTPASTLYVYFIGDTSCHPGSSTDFSSSDALGEPGATLGRSFFRGSRLIQAVRATAHEEPHVEELVVLQSPRSGHDAASSPAPATVDTIGALIRERSSTTGTPQETPEITEKAQDVPVGWECHSPLETITSPGQEQASPRLSEDSLPGDGEVDDVVISSPSFAVAETRYAIDGGVRLAGGRIGEERTMEDYQSVSQSIDSTMPPPYLSVPYS